MSNSVGLQQNGAGTHRRDLTKTGLAAAFAPLAEALERITAAAANPDARVDTRLVADHEDVADVLAVLYRTKRPDALVDQVTCHADVLDRLLDRPMADADRRWLEAVAVGQCAQAGMLARATTDYATARRYFALARSVDHDSGDATLRAQVLAVASTLHSPVLTSGRRGDSRRAAATGRAPRRRARLDALLAGDRAGLRARRARLLRGRRGRRAPVRAKRPYRRPRVLHRPRFRRTRSGEREHRGWPGAARPRRRRRRPPAPGPGAAVAARAGDPARLQATARILQDEPEQTCADLHRALDLTAPAGYTIGVERVLGVRDRFPDPWADLSCVHKLDDRLLRSVT